MTHNLIPCIYLQSGNAVTGFGQKNLIGDGDPKKLAAGLDDGGADRLLIFDFSNTDSEHDAAIECIREIAAAARIPVLAAGNIKRPEDVKKLVYAGCEKAVLNGSKQGNIEMLSEVSARFGKERIAVSISSYAEYEANRDLLEQHAGTMVLLDGDAAPFEGQTSLPIILHAGVRSSAQLAELLKKTPVYGVTGDYVSRTDFRLFELKAELAEQGISVNILTSSIPWSEFKTDASGLVPCIVQDSGTDEVLMMAWMNEESFSRTLRTGRMTYFSRSRRSLWTKGETSGHYQYLRSLSIDCDRDTMLAKVKQIGAACHTGNRSCFYTKIADQGRSETNPHRVFENVMQVIRDRREHPKEGSYTNYLFEKGLDKILKKVGEENTELIIAAKNPDSEEMIYEISDYLYHLMVLMAEKGVSWEDITGELARR